MSIELETAPDDDRELTEDEVLSLANDTAMSFTHAVSVFAATRGGLAELEALARGELAELLRDGLPAPLDLIFHSFSWHGQYNIMLAQNETALVVDLCEREELPALDAGPFKGYRVLMPTRFTEDE